MSCAVRCAEIAVCSVVFRERENHSFVYETKGFFKCILPVSFLRLIQSPEESMEEFLLPSVDSSTVNAVACLFRIYKTTQLHHPWTQTPSRALGIQFGILSKITLPGADPAVLF